MKFQMRFAALAIVTAATLSSCASISVEALPQPGNTFRGGYDVVIEFDHVLNLPDRAKVVLDGATVGVVADVALKDRGVDITARIDPAVVVPSNAHAVLQQATVLGDVFVALEPPPNGEPLAPPLGPGGRISLQRTTSPPQLEDTIASLATFVSSGSIQRMQNTIIGLNRVSPSGQDEIRKLASRVASNLSDLGQNIDTVDQLLNGMAGTADVLSSRAPQFEHWFSPKGMLGFDRGTETATTSVAIALPRVGSFYNQGFFYIPLLTSAENALKSIQHSKWAFEDEYPAWQRLLTETFLPQDRYPAINITSIVGPDGRELSGNVQDVLRILGVSP